MKVFAISDLHLDSTLSKPMDIFGPGWEGHWDKIRDDWRSKVGADDVVLLAGDLSWAMSLDEALPDIAEVGELPGAKFILRGNHDYWWSAIGKVRKALPQNMFAIQNDCIRIGKLLVCGSRLWKPSLDDRLVGGGGRQDCRQRVCPSYAQSRGDEGNARGGRQSGRDDALSAV